MNKTALATTAKTNLSKVGFALKKASPKIFLVGGIVGVVTSTVMACRASRHVDEIVDDAKGKIDDIHDRRDDPREKDYTQEEAKRDLTHVYVKTGLALTRLYAPSVVLGTLSIGGIVTSHCVMEKRNMALAAAYATVDKGYRDYRARVVERFGEDVDRELRYDVKREQIEEEATDEKGRTKTVKKQINVVGVDGYSEYARFFDEASKEWDKNPEYNLSFLKLMQNHANDRLRVHGHLFLNEVYDMLDIPRTKAGQTVGWTYSKEHPSYVDFGIYQSRRFVNGYENCILLDFNVDGNILNSFDPGYDR